MKKTVTRLILLLFVSAAFFGPFIAIVAIEQNKREAQKLADVASATDTAAARYQYYQDINNKKADLKKAMEDAKTEYEQLLKDQPSLVSDKKSTTTKTTVKPVTTQKVVQQRVTSTAGSGSSGSSSTTSTKPKASTKTKSS